MGRGRCGRVSLTTGGDGNVYSHRRLVPGTYRMYFNFVPLGT